MRNTEELEALANRIDHEELWRQPGIDRDKMTPEQQDRLMAGVYLRRYARARGNMLEQLKEGAEYMRGMRLERANRGTDQRGCGDHAWHVACNAESERLREQGGEGCDWQSIETAPKDGRKLILLLTTSGFPQVAYSNTWWRGGFSVENKPTHWMPIPPIHAAGGEG